MSSTQNESGELLSDDEQLIRHERWVATKDLRTTMIDIFITNGALTDEVYESEPMMASFDALVMLFNQLSKGTE